MKAERFQQIEALFLAASECEANKRDAFLDEACADDVELRHELDILLESDKADESFIETPALALAADLIKDLRLENDEGLMLGPYKLIRELGEGGMGAVYLATRADDQYQKLVAIKVVKLGLNTNEMRRRFRHERQILANLDHPNIARLIDGGTTGDGRPYLVMDYVEGLPITDYCDDHCLSIEERLRLFQSTCSAVAYAHRNLVIHRDIKPSNILVTEDGSTKLLDFGIAKLTPEGEFSSAQTVTVARIMTPQYASPEQIRGLPMSTASDIYSLGVLLYRLLTGHHPYRFKTSLSTEIERVICEEDPERPSASIERVEQTTDLSEKRISPGYVSSVRNEQPGALIRKLRGDLDNIVLMAMRKEPERRYLSAEQFSEDIRRYLEGQPVLAASDSFGYRTRKFIGRHKVGVAAGLLVLLSLVGATIITTREAGIARQERDRARIGQAKATQVSNFLQGILRSTDPAYRFPNAQKGQEPTLKDALDYAAGRLDDLEGQDETKAELQNIIGNSYLTLGRYDLAEQHLQSALEMKANLYGADNPEVVATLTALAQLTVTKGDVAKAEPIYQRLIEIYRKPGVADISAFAVVLNDFALILRYQARFSEAEALLREGLGLSPRIPSELQNIAGLIRTNLALVRSDQGDFAEAESLYRAGIEESRRVVGRESPDLAVGLTGLANILVEKGAYDDAEPVLVEAETIYRRLLGNEHPYLATNLSVHGYLLYHRGDYAEAEKKMERSLEILKQTVSEGHPRYTASMIGLGLIMSKTGRASQGETILRDALKIRSRLLPEGHYLIALASGALGECLATQKRFAEAEPLLTESYEQLKKSQGPRGVRTLQAGQQVVDLYVGWKRPELADRHRVEMGL